jgi:hypothetical protein
MLWPTSLQCVQIWISTGLPFVDILLTKCVLKFDIRRILLNVAQVGECLCFECVIVEVGARSSENCTA